jgi:hypothetical protein
VREDALAVVSRVPRTTAVAVARPCLVDDLERL